MVSGGGWWPPSGYTSVLHIVAIPLKIPILGTESMKMEPRKYSKNLGFSYIHICKMVGFQNQNCFHYRFD